jgi:hypothetical protein
MTAELVTENLSDIFSDRKSDSDSDSNDSVIKRQNKTGQPLSVCSESDSYNDD